MSSEWSLSTLTPTPAGQFYAMVLSGERTDGTVSKMVKESMKRIDELENVMGYTEI